MKKLLISLLLVCLACFAISCSSECKHEYEWESALSATKEAEGIVGHYHCEKCGKDFDANYEELDSVIIERLPYDVTFIYNDVVVEKKQVKAGEKTVNPKSPIGFKVDEWVDATTGTAFDFDNTTIQSDITLEANVSYDYSELPAVIVNTEEKAKITSTEDYVASTISIKNTEDDFLLTDIVAGIRGRGNATWNMAKKPYRIKFDKKQSIFGTEYKAKSWTLLACYDDITLSRNYLAFDLSKYSEYIKFTSVHYFVDLYINGNYEGVYLLCDFMQTGTGRVDINEDIPTSEEDFGFLLEAEILSEVEGEENQDWFKLNYASGDCQAFAIKTPDTEEDDFLNNKEYIVSFIKNYMTDCWNVLNSGNWTAVYDKLDVYTFADNYIIKELFATSHAANSSHYYYHDVGGKLCLGPIWDFDESAGNDNYAYGNEAENNPTKSLYVKQVNKWFNKLLSYKQFADIVKTRFLVLDDYVLQMIDKTSSESANYIYANNKKAFDRNFELWDIIGKDLKALGEEDYWPVPTEISSLDSIDAHFGYLHDWLKARFEYMQLTYANGCEHDYGKWIEAVEPTKLASGSVAHYHCIKCGCNFNENHEVIINIVIPKIPASDEKFTVTFNKNGNKVEEYTEVPDASFILEPMGVKISLGYKISEWVDSTTGNVFDFNNDIVESNLVLDAVISYDFGDMPVVVINTNDGKDITSKEIYSESKVSILNTSEEYELHEVSAGVRGRGNTTWGMAKKPYRIKFDKKQSIFGSSYKAKSWTLLANYDDITLARNYLAYHLASLSENIPFTSVHYFVEVYLNGKYRGVYLLCDQMQTGTGRVDIDEDLPEGDEDFGFMVEADIRSNQEGEENQDWFSLSYSPYKKETQMFTIKTPDTEDKKFLANKEYYVNYIKNYMSDCWVALNSNNWKTVTSKIDVSTFVDNYIVKELFATANAKASSHYYYHDVGGKLCLGPIWDFDISAGNDNYSYGTENECSPTRSLFVKEVNAWFNKLLSYTEFQNLVKERFAAMTDEMMLIIEMTDIASGKYLYGMYQKEYDRNFELWNIIGKYVWPQPKEEYVLTSVDAHFKYLHDWLLARYNYMKGFYGTGV